MRNTSSTREENGRETGYDPDAAVAEYRRLCDQGCIPEAEEAFSFIWRQEEPRIRAVAKRMLRTPDDVDDVVQNVGLILSQKLRDFRGESQLRTWLHRVTVNAALGYRRSGARYEQDVTTDSGVLEASVSRGPVGEDEYARHEDRQRVQDAIERVQASRRIILTLAELEEMSNAEIADILGMTEGAVKSALHRGRVELRQVLERSDS